MKSEDLHLVVLQLLVVLFTGILWLLPSVFLAISDTRKQLNGRRFGLRDLCFCLKKCAQNLMISAYMLNGGPIICPVFLVLHYYGFR